MIEKNYCKIKLIEEKSRFLTHSNVLREQFFLIFVDRGEMEGDMMLSSGKYIVEI